MSSLNKLPMKHQPKAKIFLADERGCHETGLFRSYHTFNFGNFFKEHKKSFEDIYVLNDDTISGGHVIDFTPQENSWILLLPVAGTVLCKVNNCIESIVHPGQLQFFKMHSGDSIEFLNCYENELINFIHIWIKATNIENCKANSLFNFDLDENKNYLINSKEPDTNCKNPHVSIGKFIGRKEAIYTLKKKQNSLFVFVIEGVFEVQGRLLHTRDGLGLLNEPNDIELEALSNDAIILVIELSSY